MTGLEIENFYKLNEEKYILEKNKEFIELYKDMLKKDLHPMLDLSQMQQLIYDIVSFYEFKYPSVLLDSINYTSSQEEIENTKEIAAMLDINQLKFRLYHDYVQFLDCPYWHYVKIKKAKDTYPYKTYVLLFMNEDGIIQQNSLEELKFGGYLKDVENIDYIVDVYEKLLKDNMDVDYSQIEKCIQTHEHNLVLRNEFLKLIPYAMIYSSNSLPENGYIRAKSFVREFNREYQLNMDLNEIEEIINRDYSEKIRERKLI